MEELSRLFFSFFDGWSSTHWLDLLVQLGVVGLSAIVAGFVQRRWRKLWTNERREEAAGFRRIAASGLSRLLFPLSMLLLVGAGRFVLGMLEQPIGVLRIAVPLLGSLALIRLTVFFLRKIFSPSRALKAGEGLISSSVWAVFALHLLGWLPGVLGALDAVSLPLGSARLSLLMVIKAGLALGAMLLVTLSVAALLEKRLMSAESLSASARVGLAKGVKFILITAGLLVALNTVGVDLTALTVFGGALGVGLGFGLQRIASNFISGFILIMDRSIRPGDVISIGTSFGWVEEMHARYIVVRSRDGVETLIPNENLITTQVINWSYSDRNVRVKVPVQISYDDDPETAMSIMMEAANQHPRVLKNPAPACRLIEFGESGINLELRVWLADPEVGVGGLRSDLNLAVWKAFKAAKITIPYPQRDLYIKYAAPKIGVEPESERRAG